jgi:hypothetical protein
MLKDAGVGMHTLTFGCCMVLCKVWLVVGCGGMKASWVVVGESASALRDRTVCV